LPNDNEAVAGRLSLPEDALPGRPWPCDAALDGRCMPHAMSLQAALGSTGAKKYRMYVTSVHGIAPPSQNRAINDYSCVHTQCTHYKWVLLKL
jgi:hypothetical protein